MLTALFLVNEQSNYQAHLTALLPNISPTPSLIKG